MHVRSCTNWSLTYITWLDFFANTKELVEAAKVYFFLVGRALAGFFGGDVRL